MNDWSMEIHHEDDAPSDYDAGYDSEKLFSDLIANEGKNTGTAQQIAQPLANSIVNRTSSAAGLTLDEAYKAFDMRESYLQRHASPMARYSDQTDLKINDFSTRTNNMWRSDDLGLFPDYTPPSCGQDSPQDNIYQAKVS